MPSIPPRVSVVIPNWNGLHHLPECTEALAAQSFQDFEIILVDNASTDGSVSWIKQHVPLARVIERPDNGGFATAVNEGIRASQSEFIALLNNDTAVDISDWTLAGDIDHTFDPGTVIVAGGTMYVTPDAKSFRARAEAPTGGMQLFVQGNYDGNLPNIGGTVQLVARDGELVSEATYTGEVSTLQEHLRV